MAIICDGKTANTTYFWLIWHLTAMTTPWTSVFSSKTTTIPVPNQPLDKITLDQSECHNSKSGIAQMTSTAMNLLGRYGCMTINQR